MLMAGQCTLSVRLVLLFVAVSSRVCDVSADPAHAATLAADVIGQLTGFPRHDVAVVLGSGWRPAADVLGVADVELAMAELPGFTPPRVAGQEGTVRSVQVGRSRVLVLLGRTHPYEGHGLVQVVHPVRAACAAGATAIVLTNAAGGLRTGMAVGQPVLISDHLNFTATSPLVGPHFVDLTDAYSPALRAAALALDPTLEEGVYAGLPGPHYETPAEIRMLRGLGADLVGMSTVHETIAARAENAAVLGISLVTNLAAGMTGQPLDHAEVLAAGAAAATRMGELLHGLLSTL
jgi:purine-nucleoside phosphorylase